MTVGEYDDGRPGEVFMKVSKQGSTLAGFMDAFSISVSLGLQHGVPLSTYVRKYSNMRFEPAGITDDPELRIATSLDGLHLPAAGRRLPATRGARGARRAVDVRAHAADVARCRGGRHVASRIWSRTPGSARYRRRGPTTGPRRHVPRRRLRAQRHLAPNSATRRCATSAAWSCSEPVPAMCARVAGRRAAVRSVKSRPMTLDHSRQVTCLFAPSDTRIRAR